MAKAASTDTNVKVRELTVAAEEGQLARVRDFVVGACEEAAFSERETSNAKLAVDEACTNIIKHAYGDGAEGEIRLRIEIERGNLNISLRDRGKRFDFDAVQDPDLDEYVETGRKGGLGVFLINRLMDGVEYNTSDDGNELVLSKRSRSAVSRGLIEPDVRPFRGTLRFKFMLRASSGLLLLIIAIWVFVFVRQTGDIGAQRTSLWMEKRRLAENLSNRSKDLLLRPDEFSVEQTNLSAYLVKLLDGNNDLSYVRVVDNTGRIVSSGIIDEIFTTYSKPAGAIELGQDDNVVWTATETDGQDVREIGFVVRVTNPDTGTLLELGHVYVGVLENVVEAGIKDPRILVSLILIGIFFVGVLLIMGLVSVFVKPIQVLTDGVRAIGDGSLDKKLDIGGPAEIGAIASVFNEITDKFKKAQVSVLEQEKMHKEMEVAKEIQQSLLPRHKPEVSGYDIAPMYQAAAEVGGDYYDFMQVDDDTIGVVVADVSGKGVPGSLVMTMIRTALRMEARGNKNASDVMSKMNAFVTDDMKKGMFVTIFYVILDSKNRVISYASAGHNPMILYRHETRETFFLNPRGFPVGISLPDEELFRKSISLEKIKLKKDDMLLIYTDGVTEAMNERRDQYGEDRLLEMIKEYGKLHPSEFIAALERDIKKFTGDNPQNDDITVVAIKEKLTADDVLYGIRKKLMDLVEVKGLSVREACQQMNVSPTTYYRYKKRLDLMGERGLKDKVLRQDTVLKRVSLEARKEILKFIEKNPGYGAKRITALYNEGKPENRQVTERMVYDELKRLNLNTKELRIEYLRRNRLLDEQKQVGYDRSKDKDIVEELIGEIPVMEPGEDEDAFEEVAVGDEPGDVVLSGERAVVFEQSDDIGLSVVESKDDVTTIQVDGHLDSVTSATLENLLKRLVSEGNVKYVVDLSGVTYISSGGWGIFSGEVRNLRESGGDVVLVGMTAEVHDVYELLGFNDVIKAFTTREDGCDYYKLPPEERLATLPSPRGETTPGAGTGVGAGFPESGFGATEELPGESYVPEWESLKIEATTVGEKGDIAVLSLHGIIDTVSAENLRAALSRVVTGGINKIVVDMSQVEYVSSGGWGTFTERLREVRRNDGDIKLFGMDPDVYYVFTMLGFNIVLSSFDILTEAIDDFDREGSGSDIIPGGPMAEHPAGTHPEISEKDRARADSTTGRALDIDLSSRASGDIVTWEDLGDGVVVAHMFGYIEASAVNVLAASMMQELAAQPRATLFDLEGVRYMSSTGWGQFAKCYETVQEWGGTTALYGLSAELYDIYSCLEFASFIKAYPDKDAAIASIDAEPEVSAETVVDDRPETPAAQAPAPGEDTGEEILSVDDILEDAQESHEPEAQGITEAESPHLDRRQWPGESEPEKLEDLADSQSHEAADSPKEQTGGQFVDMSQGADVVDVESAVSDKNIEKDQDLRKVGWEAYGERLKRRNKSRKNKKD